MKFSAPKASFGTTEWVLEVWGCVCLSAELDEETSLHLSVATKHHPILYGENPSHSRREGVANSTEQSAVPLWGAS